MKLFLRVKKYKYIIFVLIIVIILFLIFFLNKKDGFAVTEINNATERSKYTYKESDLVVSQNALNDRRNYQKSVNIDYVFPTYVPTVEAFENDMSFNLVEKDVLVYSNATKDKQSNNKKVRFDLQMPKVNNYYEVNTLE